MFAVIGSLVMISNHYTLNGIKSRTVGDGQYGTARFATEKEIRETYAHVPYEPEQWRAGKHLPKEQGLVVGYKKKGNFITALVDSGDIHCLMIGAAGVGKTANFLYPNIEYACASGMSFLTTDTKGDLFRNYAGIAKEYYGYRISILDLRNPTRSDGNNILTLVNKYMDEYLKNPENLAAKARAEKYAKITAKTIICSEGASASSYGQNAFFYDAAEGLLTSVILLIAEYCPPEKRHIISVFKLIQDLLAPSPVKNRSLFQLLMDKLPPTHKAKWFAGAALNSADQAMASVLSTTMSRLNAFLDSEMEQILCFESTLDTETFCREKSAIFIVLPEEDNTKYFMVSLFLQQLYREMLTIADEHGGKLPNRVMMFADEIGTIPKIESMEMMFSAGRSRRISMVPIIQSFAQLEKNYGKEGSSIIIDNCQDILFGGFAPNSESAEILSKALGNRTVLSGSISRGKNDPSQSLQMMSRPLMAPEELKTLPKGNFILAKTGVCPMKTRLPLFFKWGIRFEEVYEVSEQAAREVVYADRLELEEEIVRRSDFDEEDLWRGSVESGKLEEASFLGGKAHGETAKEKQHKAATEVMVETFKGTQYDTGLDQNLLAEIADYFQPMREEALKSGLMNTKVLGVNIKTLLYQVPGGMLSNLVSQLKEAGAEDKYRDVLEEIPRVRKDYGEPPLVTPSSQIVGTQAVLNVLQGERYKMITKESKKVLAGEFGQTIKPFNPEVQKKAIGDTKPITCRPADLIEPQLEKFKNDPIVQQYKQQDEDVLSYALFPQVATEFFKYREAQQTKVDPTKADTANKAYPV